MRLIYLVQNLLHFTLAYIYILKVYIRCVLERIYFSHRRFHLLVELMWTNALENPIFVVRQDNIPLRIQLKDKMICVCAATKCENDNSLYPHLADAFKPFGAEELSKFHGETRGDGFFIFLILDSMKPDSIFD